MPPGGQASLPSHPWGGEVSESASYFCNFQAESTFDRMHTPWTGDLT